MRCSPLLRAALVLTLALVLPGCPYGPYADRLTTVRPEPEDLIGRYVLREQTLVPGDMSALQGRACEVVLGADGNFTANNIPPLEHHRPAIESLDELVSGSGSWRIQSTGSVDRGWGKPKTVWGVDLRDPAGQGFSIASFTGEEAPHGLLFAIGDPDSDDYLLLELVERR